MKIGRVGIIGAGVMGSGISQICAQAGWLTVIYDPYPESLERCKKSIMDFWERGVDKGKNSSDDVRSWKKNLVLTVDIADASKEADLIIEAVPENIDLKRSIFRDLDKLAPSESVLATNTSALSISEIASATNNPERVVGMHFFNPVPLMPLLEIVRHDSIAEDVISTARQVGKALGKTSILVDDTPGFATSRLGVVLGNEAIRMVAEGVASASDIDTAMRLGYRHPMGPLELSDLVGLDVRRDILNNLAEAFDDESYRPHQMLEDLVEAGNLGKKTGAGIYDWSSGEKSER